MIVIRNANYPLGLTSGLAGSFLSSLHYSISFNLPTRPRSHWKFLWGNWGICLPTVIPMSRGPVGSLTLYLSSSLHYSISRCSLPSLPPSLLKRNLGKHVAQYMFPKYPRLAFSACKESLCLSEPLKLWVVCREASIWLLSAGRLEKSRKEAGKVRQLIYSVRQIISTHVLQKSLLGASI